MLGVTEVSVNRTLQRRAQRHSKRSPRRASANMRRSQASAEELELVDRFTTAFEGRRHRRRRRPAQRRRAADDATRGGSNTKELQRSAVLSRPCPPAAHSTASASSPREANGQPAFGCYLRDEHAPIAHALRAHGPPTLSGNRVAAITRFPDTSVFASFGCRGRCESSVAYDEKLAARVACAARRPHRQWASGRCSAD